MYPPYQQGQGHPGHSSHSGQAQQPRHGHPPSHGYSSQGYSGQGYQSQGYPSQGYQGQGQPHPGRQHSHPGHGQSQQAQHPPGYGHPGQAHPGQAHPTQAHPGQAHPSHVAHGYPRGHYGHPHGQAPGQSHGHHESYGQPYAAAAPGGYSGSGGGYSGPSGGYSHGGYSRGGYGGSGGYEEVQFEVPADADVESEAPRRRSSHKKSGLAAFAEDLKSGRIASESHKYRSDERQNSTNLILRGIPSDSLRAVSRSNADVEELIASRFARFGDVFRFRVNWPQGVTGYDAGLIRGRSGQHESHVYIAYGCRRDAEYTLEAVRRRADYYKAQGKFSKEQAMNEALCDLLQLPELSHDSIMSLDVGKCVPLPPLPVALCATPGYTIQDGLPCAVHVDERVLGSDKDAVGSVAHGTQLRDTEFEQLAAALREMDSMQRRSIVAISAFCLGRGAGKADDVASVLVESLTLSETPLSSSSRTCARFSNPSATVSAYHTCFLPSFLPSFPSLPSFLPF
ncbi:MAG: hypothetical protein MHM6MM_008479, partial [Cercozoa sp. M6MM]